MKIILRGILGISKESFLHWEQLSSRPSSAVVHMILYAKFREKALPVDPHYQPSGTNSRGEEKSGKPEIEK